MCILPALVHAYALGVDCVFAIASWQSRVTIPRNRGSF